MSYHFARSFKLPKTKKEKLRAAKQYFVCALLFGSIACALIGWDYWQQKKQAELLKIRAEPSKVEDELIRDLVRTQRGGTQQTQTPSPVKEPPTEKRYVLGETVPIILPILFGSVSLLNIFMGALYAVESSRMTETIES
jgi:hypothetical protein